MFHSNKDAGASKKNDYPANLVQKAWKRTDSLKRSKLLMKELGETQKKDSLRRKTIKMGNLWDRS